MLFYSVPVLEGILPHVYLKHYCLLVTSLHLLLSEHIAMCDLQRAELWLLKFYSECELLYGN